MTFAQGHGSQILHVGTDIFHLAQGAARRHKGKGAAVDLFQRLPPDGQTESVHRHHSQALVRDLEQGTGMDGAALIGGDSEGRLLDHGTQQLLLDGDGKIILHHGQLRVIRRGEAQDIKVRIAAGEMDQLFVIRGENHHIVGHPADDVAEEAGV